MPAGSVAVTVTVFGPSVRVMPEALKVVPVTVASTPFTVTEAVSSSTVPETVMTDSLVVVPSRGDVTDTTGGLLSMVKLIVVLPVFPARSVAVTVSS